MRPPPFRLERYFAEYEFKVKYHMCASDCETFSVGELLQCEPNAAKEFQELRLGYTESRGNPRLRVEIANLYNKLSADHILVHSGAEEAIFNFMNAVLKKNDHVIVHWPCYQSLYEIAIQIGCSVSKWRGTPENNWELNLKKLETLIRPCTKLLIINCPHNPTGYLMSRKMWNRVNKICENAGIFIFSDEVYRFLEYDSDNRLPAFCDLNANAFTLGVMSKSFGLPGLRIGWIATQNKSLLERLAIFKDYTTICSSTTSEFLACLALQNRDRIIQRNMKLIKENLSALDSFFKLYSHRFIWNPPSAGPIGFVSLVENDTADTFCSDLVQNAGVLLLPGSLYDEAYSRYFRIGFGRQNFPECIDQLDKYMKKH